MKKSITFQTVSKGLMDGLRSAMDFALSSPGQTEASAD